MKLPYGISNFAKLVNEGYYFVDKTKFLVIFAAKELAVFKEV